MRKLDRITTIRCGWRTKCFSVHFEGTWETNPAGSAQDLILRLPFFDIAIHTGRRRLLDHNSQPYNKLHHWTDATWANKPSDEVGGGGVRGGMVCDTTQSTETKFPGLILSALLSESELTENCAFSDLLQDTTQSWILALWARAPFRACILNLKMVFCLQPPTWTTPTWVRYFVLAVKTYTQIPFKRWETPKDLQKRSWIHKSVVCLQVRTKPLIEKKNKAKTRDVLERWEGWVPGGGEFCTKFVRAFQFPGKFHSTKIDS